VGYRWGTDVRGPGQTVVHADHHLQPRPLHVAQADHRPPGQARPGRLRGTCLPAPTSARCWELASTLLCATSRPASRVSRALVRSFIDRPPMTTDSLKCPHCGSALRDGDGLAGLGQDKHGWFAICRQCRERVDLDDVSLPGAGRMFRVAVLQWSQRGTDVELDMLIDYIGEEEAREIARLARLPSSTGLAQQAYDELKRVVQDFRGMYGAASDAPSALFPPAHTPSLESHRFRGLNARRPSRAGVCAASGRLCYPNYGQ